MVVSIGLLLVLGGCSGGCSSNSRSPQTVIVPELPEGDPLAMVIKRRSDSTSAITASQITRSLKYTNIPYLTHDLDLLSDSLFTIPESVRLICLTTGELEDMADREVEQLVASTAAGNAMLVTQPVWDHRFGYLLGIKPGAEYRQQVGSDGFRFHQTVFPGFENGTYSQPLPYYHRGFHADMFSDNIELIATSNDSLDSPVILENRVGRGSTLFFNSQIGFEKSYRGLLFSLMLKKLEGVAYPVANISTIFLDDFPAPLYNEKLPPIDWEYDITHAEFVTDIWWPDMQKLADKYLIDYSAMIAFNYNANVVPPFDFEEWTLSGINIQGTQRSGSIGLAKNVAESRHELAFHGYNHFSLWLNDWPNEEFMIGALQAARKRWRIDNLGPLPKTYVPPTNLIDSTGLQALVKGMPQIEYMSSLYIGNPEEGTGREFGPDPYAPTLFDYPRISSGFIADDNSMFKQHSLYLLTGIWTHFVHPDDVFQVEQSKEDIFASRNERGLGWHKSRDVDYGLYEVFKRRLQETIHNYPYIRFRAARDAAPLVEDWTKTQAYRSDSGESRQIVYNLNQVQQRRGVEFNPSYWFLYVTEANREIVENRLDGQVEQLTFRPVWDGYLAQFSTFRDTLEIPDLQRIRDDSSPRKEMVTSAVKGFRSYMTRDTATVDSVWSDTRLRDALAELNSNPQSDYRQDRVIDLAVEFDRLDLAISLLEKQLLTDEVWNSRDIQKLVTLYGWAGNIGQGWSFLEKLWQRHQDQSVIALKEMMTQQYGTPEPGFRERWLSRALSLDPGNEQLLLELARLNENEENWPRARNYLERLLQMNPASDTLYRYSLQRSLWYGQPDSTTKWLNSFPDHAQKQLQPLADEIASLYAYSHNNYEEALYWADISENISTQTRLQWIRQAGRQQEFEQKAVTEVSDEAADDSLRAYVGTEFIYDGKSTLGYEILYPLFRKNSVPDEVRELIHTEIGYQTYEDKKRLYRRYPAFFSREMVQDLQYQYRTAEGVSGGLQVTYSDDNFNNETATAGIASEWGHRHKTTHTVTAGRQLVQSAVNAQSLTDQLNTISYTLRHNFRRQSRQFNAGAGVRQVGDELLPELSAGMWWAGTDSTFTSGQVSFNPVMTNTAITRDINQFKGTIYREDYWLKKGRLMTTLSGTANWYTDDVFSYETLGRFYLQLPFSTSVIRARGIGEAAYLDATTEYTDGVPYWTPGDLLIKGAGLDIRYQDAPENPDVRIEAEIMGKHNRDGFYITSAARLNARLARYWQLRINAGLSSSSIYRSNSVGIGLRYIFPKQLIPDR